MTHFGLLNINKPKGITSRRVVDHVQRLVRPAKAGHAGTLDPLATGVLVVCVGPATRLIEYVQQMPKQYRAEFLLGRSSPTEDIESEVTLLDDPPQPTLADIRRAAAALVGQIEQRPPAYSALKVAGQRAYSLARSGKTVELQVRTIHVYRLDVVAYEYPQLTLDIECGSGTYVRSLGRELAASLGTAAVMSALVRAAIGPFRVKQALNLSDLTAEVLESRLISPLVALGDMPRVQLSRAAVQRVANGLSVSIAAPAASEYAALDNSGQLVAILAWRPDGQLGPTRYFRR